MENFTEDEIKSFTDMETVKDMIAVLDTVLDGEIYHVRASDTDVTLDNSLKPVLPKGLVEKKNSIVVNNKKVYAFILQVLIALIIDLNPRNIEEEEDYAFRIAIIIDSIAIGSVFKNKNWIESSTEFNKDFIKQNGKDLIQKHEKLISMVKSKIDAAHNFLAFSAMNMVRFNHHFPYDKINLINKSLISLPDEHRERILEEDKLTTFYNLFVTAARISNDKFFYEKYLMKMENDNNTYYLYPILGIYNPHFEEDIINIRKDCTPNSFLILDIVNEIVNDLTSKKLLFLIPYRNQLATLLNIRNHIRLNPFSYHPSKNFYKCKAQDFEKVNNLFQSTMRDIGSFIFEYSDNMYESVRSAKCRSKYQKNIKKEDEILVKNIIAISSTDIEISKEKINVIKKKLYTSNYEVNEDTDLEEVNKQCLNEFENMVNIKIFN